MSPGVTLKLLQCVAVTVTIRKLAAMMLVQEARLFHDSSKPENGTQSISGINAHGYAWFLFVFGCVVSY